MDPLILFKALSDPTRLRAVFLLMQHEELCVCELIEALGLPQPKVSHHLAALRRAALVTDRKDGLWIHYRINPELPDWCLEVLVTAMEGVRLQSPFASDLEALHVMTERPGRACN